ncbi:MAG: hypothetical protein CFE36_09710 [Sphingomonadaceae bacterium PASS1]|nr:MAG: hypothetical protein CFE36_09710 [Sphingomonadaceae bacterium PASS1]
MPHKAASSNDNELPTGEGGSFAHIIPLLLGLRQDLSKNASASFLKAWNPDGSQIELVDLVIEQLTATETVDPAGLSEELAHALMDPAISDLLPEADALQIVGMLNKVKATGSSSW